MSWLSENIYKLGTNTHRYQFTGLIFVDTRKAITAGERISIIRKDLDQTDWTQRGEWQYVDYAYLKSLVTSLIGLGLQQLQL